jgi:hypothetical protein
MAGGQHPLQLLWAEPGEKVVATNDQRKRFEVRHRRQTSSPQAFVE